MNIELTTLSDGRVMLVSDRPMPHIVQRIEYYREQKLFSLVWYDPELEDQLMHHELPIDMAMAVERVPEILICALYPNQKTLKYNTPLVKIGDSF